MSSSKPPSLHTGASLQRMIQGTPFGLCFACCLEYKQAEAGGFGGKLPMVYPAVTMVAKVETQNSKVIGGPVVGLIALPICDRHMTLQTPSRLLNPNGGIPG